MSGPCFAMAGRLPSGSTSAAVVAAQRPTTIISCAITKLLYLRLGGTPADTPADTHADTCRSWALTRKESNDRALRSIPAERNRWKRLWNTRTHDSLFRVTYDDLLILSFFLQILPSNVSLPFFNYPRRFFFAFFFLRHTFIFQTSPTKVMKAHIKR
jgi:hypothetical protein